MDEILRVIQYLKSCRNANIDCTITIDKRKTHLILNALTKRIPMKVREVHLDEYYCPACGSENNCNDGIVGDKFCPECGQALHN
ncbi:MAG: hypothetical protein IJO13_04755 [Lachnospiraceae bacterium]|nr:hypothetical protein [Lachnospiraceae bacterium]